MSQVLVSLWDVEDRSAARLISHFYDELGGDSGSRHAAAALRRAQLRLRSEPGMQEPFYWAPFVLHGASDPND